MISRVLAEKLKKDAQSYPVVTVTGPRQSGKTTLVRDTFGEHDYVSLEDPDQRAYALSDPRGFLAQFSGSVILDEAHQAPDLFSYIQGAVDEKDGGWGGRYILTGSHNFLLLGQVSQSLAGRTAVRHLLPFSMDELLGREVAPPQDFGSKIPRCGAKAGGPEGGLMTWLHRGFYPRIHDRQLDPADWLANYYQTYLQRDVRDVLNVGSLDTFRRFVGLCAGRSGQLLNMAALGSDAGVSHDTARRWLGVLQASFIVSLIRPHHRNFNKRMIKSPKLYFLDSGLLCYLLRIRSPEDLRLHASRGAIFEGFVVAELLKRAHNKGLEPDLYFWRDSAGHEVDLIVDRGQSLLPVEIKSGETLNADFFRGLSYWRKLARAESRPAALIHGGESSSVHSGVAVYSWWQF